MNTAKQLQQLAFSKLKAAKDLLHTGNLDSATSEVGYAVELMLKARVCNDLGLSVWPATISEFAKFGIKHLRTHDFKTLLDSTHVSHLPTTLAVEWGHCMKWSIETRYQAVGTATRISTTELIESAEKIVRRLWNSPGSRETLSGDVTPTEKLWVVAEETEIQHGPLSLFMLAHRSGTHNTSWDLVVAAPWIDRDWRSGVANITNILRSNLTDVEQSSISAIIHLECTHPIVEVITNAAGQPSTVALPTAIGGGIQIQDWAPLISGKTGIEVKLERASIIRSQHQE